MNKIKNNSNENMLNEKKTEAIDGSNNMSALTAVAIGAVVGAVGATALAMRNKKINKTVTEEVGSKVSKTKASIQKEAKKVRGNVTAKINDIKEGTLNNILKKK